MPNRSTARRWPRRLIIGVVVVVILAVGIPFTYIHFIEGKAPAKLSLTPSARASDVGANSDGSSAGKVGGPWSVAQGSIVGYRVSETLLGQKNTAVGRTEAVSGLLRISGATVRSATFTAQMASVHSDESQRDAQFDGRIMDVAKYPTATFNLTSPIALGATPPVGTIRRYPAVGTLAMHGHTHEVRFTIAAERTTSGLEVQGDINITFAIWGIANPSFGSFVTTAQHGTLEFLLRLKPGTTSVSQTTTPTTTAVAGGGPGGHHGRPPKGAKGSPPGGGGGGPGITVSATTTPPLTIAR